MCGIIISMLKKHNKQNVRNLYENQKTRGHHRYTDENEVLEQLKKINDPQAILFQVKEHPKTIKKQTHFVFPHKHS